LGAADTRVDGLIETDEEAEGDFVFENLDAFRIALVVQEGDTLADEADGSLEVATADGDGAVLGDLAADRDAEVVAQVLRRGPYERNFIEVARERGLPGRGMDSGGGSRLRPTVPGAR